MEKTKKYGIRFLNKISDWLQQNKLLLVFILMCLPTAFSSLEALMNGETGPEIRELIIAHDLGEGSTIGFLKQGKTLVAQVNQSVVRMGIRTNEGMRGTFFRAFDEAQQDVSNQSSTTKLELLYQGYLPKLADFQRKQLERLAQKPAFGVSPFPEVQKMRINGQPVPEIMTFIDKESRTWYIWYYPHLELKTSDNVVEFDD